MKSHSVRVMQSFFCMLAAFVATVAPMKHARSAPAEPVKVASTISASDWEAYRSRFVQPDGRVMDNANGDISHSEGQGYGLLLALGAEDRGTFEKIWSFTLTEFLIRDDGLAVWKWDPAASPHVTDRNNATDGDILIAYALGRAGVLWKEDRYLKAAQRLAAAIGKTAIGRDGDTLFLLPGASGFGADDRPDGPVVNLSYWIYEAFPVLASLAPEYDWSAVWRRGLVLLQQATTGKAKLPADWISIRARAQLRTADGLPPEFGYNSLRIPLYLLRAGMTDMDWLRVVNQRWKTGSEGVAVVNVLTGEVRERLTDQGYVAMSAALSCALDGTPIPAGLKTFQPQLYYPATLYLLSMSLVGEKYPKCL
jgi:endo-1,4-beta-D-glucanase Y